tara:strand:+ start:37 stop:687 length:651 start_codon:yes stop_codon:yes gene_type:complete
LDHSGFYTVLFYAVLAFEGLAALLAFVRYKKYSHTYLRYFPWLLLYTFVTEIAATFMWERFEGNVVLYNIYNIVFFLYFYFVFYKHTKSIRDRNLILIATAIFLVSCVANLGFSSFLENPQLLAYITGACMLIFCIILYFVGILYTPRVLKIKTELLFWVSIGLLLFYVGYIPIKITRHFFTEIDNSYHILRSVHRILVLIMNACFIIGFLWTRRK